MRLAGLALLMAGLAGCAPAAADAPVVRSRSGPVRVVSINPCVDAVLMQVADARQIAGISHYSQDERATSIGVSLARKFNATSGTAEEVVALAPDLVIAGGHVEPSTIAALGRLGIPLVLIGVPETIEQSNAQIRQIAKAVGHTERGERLVQRINAAVIAAAPDNRRQIPALIWQGGGMVPGEGTLAGELLTATGFRNMSADYGLAMWDVLPLEQLVARPPRVLLSVGSTARSDRMLGHPVLKHFKTSVAVREYPERLLHCGGPTIIDSVQHLANIRRSL